MRKGHMIMTNNKVRINKITLWDIKNVEHGVFHFNTADALRQEKASIAGIYGQNASGKTVVIEALAIIKHIMKGERIPPRYLDSISSGKSECSIEIEFLIMNDDANTNIDCTATYKCSLSRRNDPNESDENPKEIISVVSESLRARGTAFGEKYILQDIARTDESCSLLLPIEKQNILFGTNQDVLKALEHQKILALYGSRSFLFSSQARGAILQAQKLNDKSYVNWPLITVMALYEYANFRLFVIDELTVLNLDFHFISKFEKFTFPLNVPALLSSGVSIPMNFANEINQLLPRLNSVISVIVPGLALECKFEKASLDESDNKYRIEFFSCREGLGTFPFKNESLGIKKIVSFIVLLIEAYNNPGFTLAIDEMDASIFEYLLGEILDIMGSFGKGQLLFTSHNLRPLERLDSHSIWFTTTDPSNRYTQLSKKATNNLRDMYLRAVHLGNDGVELYSGESKSALAHAFRKMGRN